MILARKLLGLQIVLDGCVTGRSLQRREIGNHSDGLIRFGVLFHVPLNKSSRSVFVAEIIDLSVHIFQEHGIIVRFDCLNQVKN